MELTKQIRQVLVITMLVMQAPVWATTIITLKSNVSVAQPDILIGDIATVETEDINKKERIQNIKVGSVNRTGRPKSVGVPQVAYWLKRNNINPDQVNINGQSQVMYRKSTSTKRKGTSELLKRVQIFYQTTLQTKALEIKAKMPFPSLPPITPQTKIEFYPKGQLEEGRLAITIDNGHQPHRLILSFDIQVRQSVVVSTVDIPAQSKINLNFLKIEEKVLDKISRSSGQPVTEIASVVGQISKRQIRQGKIITKEDFQKQYYVTKGSIIIIIAQRDRLNIQAQGIANENGDLGQLIRVKNITSKKIIVGQVIDKKKVQVHF
jgi:flagella basal body P-ring formation protein FlgA